jgi:spore maturation protein A
MLNTIWLLLIIVSTAVAIITGNVNRLVVAVTESAGNAFQLALGLTGIMALWIGMMRIAEQSGLVQHLTHLIQPLLRFLFPKLPSDHPALGSMAMNMAANIFGLANAATPLGIKAMEDLQNTNECKDTASDEMCMFLAINTSSIQLVPASAIALLAAGGSSEPTSIVLPAIIATLSSTFFGITAAKVLARLHRFQLSCHDESKP